jgi:hypothetical protein
MPKVDRSELPRHLQTLPIFDSLEDYLISELRDPTFRWETAIHEAAHGKYFLRAGAVRLIYRGPRFAWSEEKGLKFVYGGMNSEWPSSGYIDFKAVARYCVAGGVAESMLTASKNVGSEIDKEIFVSNFHKCHPTASDAEIQFYWDRAIFEVKKDLENEATRNEIREIARDFDAFLVSLIS